MAYVFEHLPNLALLAEYVARDGLLPARVRTEWRSAIESFSRVCGRAPSEIVADPQHLRQLMNTASWQMAGLSRRSWSNVLSRLRALLEHAGIEIDRRRNFPLAPAWTELAAVLPAEKRKYFGGFAGWCTAREIIPAHVTQDTFVAFLDYCSTRIMRGDPKDYWRTARVLWNEIARRLPERRLPIIEIVDTDRRYGIPWREFPETLRQEVDGLKNWLQEDELDDLDDLSEVMSGYRRSRSHRPLKPSTIRVYEYDLRNYCSHLVQAGIPIEMVTDLRVVTDPANVKLAFHYQLGKAGLKQPAGKICFRLFGQINAVMAAARFLKLPGQTMALLGKRYNWVRPKQGGMSARKRAKLAPFNNREVEEAFLDLPAIVAIELSKIAKPNFYDALEMQCAAALELLTHWPARAGNIAGLDLQKHIQRPPGGAIGEWQIMVDAEEVKNEMPLYRKLNEGSSAILEYYVRKFRPLLLGNTTSSALFVTRHGKPKARAQLAIEVKRFVKRRLGIDFNLHLMRTLAGTIHLSEFAGHYADVKNILGHKDINTTLKSYIDMERDRSYELYDKALERRRGTSGVRFQDRDKRKPARKSKRNPKPGAH